MIRSFRHKGLETFKDETMLHHHPHPGELLREEVLAPLGLGVTEAAARLKVSRVALSRVLNGHAAVSPELAIRLEKAGAGTARFWLTLQTHHDLATALKRKHPRVQPLDAPA